MDVQMPGCDGVEATQMVTQALPAFQIVMLTVSDDEAHLLEALKSGASGYLLKSLDGDRNTRSVLPVIGTMRLLKVVNKRVILSFVGDAHTATRLQRKGGDRYASQLFR